MPVNVRELGVDLYSISGHKFGAPKGVGALYVRKGTSPRADALSAGIMSATAARARRMFRAPRPWARGGGLGFDWNPRSRALRDRLERGILARVPGASVNGSREPALPNTTNIRFDGIEGEAIVIALDLRGYAVSSGSACSSGAVEPSHVLLAMGLTPEEARSSVRFSLGPGNTEAEVDGLIEAVEASVAHLRRISPA